MTAPPPRHQPFKTDDVAVLPGPRMSPRSIDHTSEQSQDRSERSDRESSLSQNRNHFVFIKSESRHNFDFMLKFWEPFAGEIGSEC